MEMTQPFALALSGGLGNQSDELAIATMRDSMAGGLFLDRRVNAG